jgi:hypothetical protein
MDEETLVCIAALHGCMFESIGTGRNEMWGWRTNSDAVRVRYEGWVATRKGDHYSIPDGEDGYSHQSLTWHGTKRDAAIEFLNAAGVSHE